MKIHQTKCHSFSKLWLKCVHRAGSYTLEIDVFITPTTHSHEHRHRPLMDQLLFIMFDWNIWIKTLNENYVLLKKNCFSFQIEKPLWPSYSIHLSSRRFSIICFLMMVSNENHFFWMGKKIWEKRAAKTITKYPYNNNIIQSETIWATDQMVEMW